MRRYFILSIFLLPFILFGDDNLDISKDIAKLIDEIHHSSGDARREKINSLKIKIRKLNIKTRDKEILKIKRVLSKHHLKSGHIQHNHKEGRVHRNQKHNSGHHKHHRGHH